MIPLLVLLGCYVVFVAIPEIVSDARSRKRWREERERGRTGKLRP